MLQKDGTAVSVKNGFVSATRQRVFDAIKGKEINNDVVSGNASISSGTGRVASTSFAPNTISVNLTGIVDVENKSVNATDVSQTKLQSGSVASAVNFQADINANGVINASDVSQVKLRVGFGVP